MSRTKEKRDCARWVSVQSFSTKLGRVPEHGVESLRYVRGLYRKQDSKSAPRSVKRANVPGWDHPFLLIDHS